MDESSIYILDIRHQLLKGGCNNVLHVDLIINPPVPPPALSLIMENAFIYLILHNYNDTGVSNKLYFIKCGQHQNLTGSQ